MKRLFSFAAALGEGVEPFWVPGLAAALLFLGKHFLPLQGEGYEWAQYLVLGVVFPVLLLAVQWLRRPAWWPEAATRGLRLALALGCLLPWKYLFKGSAGFWLLLLGAGQVLLLGAFAFRRRAGGAARAAVACALLLSAWLVAARWLWWKPLDVWAAASAYSACVLAAAVLLAAYCFARLGDRSAGPSFDVFALAGGRFAPPAGLRRAAAALRDVPALAVLALASVYVHGSGMHYVPGNPHAYTAHHHWGAVVGSAHFVRQGGWLLWDAPSQYGFLSTLAIARLPIRDVWQSAYTLNAILYVLTSSFLFLLLRTLRPGPAHYVFSLLLTLAAVFLLPGLPAELTGPFVTPAVGPLRFFWCYALVAVLVGEHRRAAQGEAGTAPLWAGCFAWLAGSFWSAESAVYCAVVWLPAYVVLVLRRARLRQAGGWRALALRLSVPPLLGVAAVAGITAVYRGALGHGPDWRMYIEYCQAMSVFAMLIEPRGAVWVLLLVFLAVATAAAHVLREPDGSRDLPLLLGAGGALWAASSYYVGRSHEINATNLSPFILLAVAATLHVLRRRQEGAAWAAWVRLSFLPVLTMMLVAAFGNAELLAGRLHDFARGYRARIANLLPSADPALKELLAEAGVGAKTPLLFHDNRPAWLHAPPVWEADGRRVTAPPAWMPGGPLTVYIPLPRERCRLYFARFAERTHRSGWLLEPDEPTNDALAWIPAQLAQSHAPGRTLVRGGWRMTWYEYRGGPALAGR